MGASSVILRARRVILLGGGMLYAKLLALAKANGFALVAVTSKRHLTEKVDQGRTLKEFLSRQRIPHQALDTLSESRLKAVLGSMKDSVAITLGAPWRIDRGLIEGVFEGRIMNCHGTRLPTYRGGALFSWNILRGNRLGLCLIQRLNETDTGEIVRWEEFVYPASCRVPQDYEAYYAQKNAAFLIDFLKKIRKGPLAYLPVGQPEYLSSFFPRLNSRLNGWINWDWALEDVERFICAFDDPYPGAMTTCRGRRVRLKTVVAQRNDGRGHPCQAGLVYRNNGRWLMVSCGDGELVVQKVLDRRGRNVLGRIRPGERFVTARENLESAKRAAHFTAVGESLRRESDPLAHFAAGPANGSRAVAHTGGKS